jgi:hypothetical protein
MSCVRGAAVPLVASILMIIRYVRVVRHVLRRVEQDMQSGPATSIAYGHLDKVLCEATEAP